MDDLQVSFTGIVGLFYSYSRSLLLIYSAASARWKSAWTISR
jgi:hypothetical protein